jgi:FlaG/FlaF family flagellin (archaellin)
MTTGIPRSGVIVRATVAVAVAVAATVLVALLSVAGDAGAVSPHANPAPRATDLTYEYDSSAAATTVPANLRTAPLSARLAAAGAPRSSTSSFSLRRAAEEAANQAALRDLVNEVTHGGRKALSIEDATTVLEWGKEYNYPGLRAKPGDVASPSNWKAKPVPHIHLPGAGRGGHVPVDPGVLPLP